MTKKDSDGSVLVRFAHTRDAEDNPVAIERESGLGVFCYEYDAASNRTLLRHCETGAVKLTQAGMPYVVDDFRVAVI